MRERYRDEGTIATPEQYWFDERVSQATLEHIGSRASRWDKIGKVMPEYLTVGTWGKYYRGKHSPASSIRPTQVVAKLRENRGKIELYSSFWQREDEQRPDYPTRTLLLWDVEFFDSGYPYRDPKGAFQTMEPVYQLLHKTLESYGIDFLSVLTGRGYHFITQVPALSVVMDDLVRVGNVIEPTVAGKQAKVPLFSKRRKPVPPKAELSFKGAARIQQFLITKTMREAREVSRVAVELSDKREYGIALDNTTQTRTVDTSTYGIPGSLYFIKPSKYVGPYGLDIIRVPRTWSGNQASLDDVLHHRANYAAAVEWLGKSKSSIPNGDEGVRRLIQDYERSELRKLHQAMDSSFGDDPKDFSKGYRNYDLIADRTRNPGRIREIIWGANDLLLKPGELNYFIWEVFQTWGGSRDNLAPAPHVAGLLRAIYEDPRFNWGTRWTRHEDAFRHARGWVEIMLGQAFERDY